MTAARVLILGGGFGGLAAAYALREAAGDRADLLVIDAAPAFMMGLRKLWLLDGRGTREEGTRPRSALDTRGIPFRLGRVEGIDLESRRVVVDGDALRFDYLVAALGAESRPDLIPGGLHGAPDLYDVNGAEEAGRRLAALERGTVLIVIAGLPYKCPPAPFEAAFLVDDFLYRAGRRDAVRIEVLTPQPSSLPSAGEAACAQVEGTLAARGIAFRTRAKVERVESTRVVTAAGEVEGDLILVVPPHRPPDVVRRSGLVDGDWVKVDPRTLATAAPDVFAVGDVTMIPMANGQMLPKAGVFAETQGEGVGRNIAARILGRAPGETFAGVGYCFIETGGGEASRVEGNFLADPPAVQVAEPAPTHLEAKMAFERERLRRWFG